MSGATGVRRNTAQTSIRKRGATQIRVGSAPAQPAAIGIDVVGAQTQNTLVTFTGTWTVSAPTGMTYSFSAGGSGTLGSFSTHSTPNTWTGTATVPNLVGSTTITVTGTGPNTAQATSNSFALGAAAGTPLAVDAGGIWFDAPAPGEQALVISGSHHWFNLQDTAQLGAFDFTAYLSYLKNTQKTNFIRFWNFNMARWQGTGSPGWTWDLSPLPFNRPGPGTAHDGGAKFDLTSFNSTFFTRLLTRVQAAAAQGLYCSVMLFEGFSENTIGGQATWIYSYWNGDNNINGTSNVAGSAETLTAPVQALEEAYVLHMISVLGNEPNIIWEICNESPNNSLAWQQHWFDYLKAHQTAAILVNTTAYGPGSTGINQAVLSAAHLDAFAPGQYSFTQGTLTSNPPDVNSYSSKVLILDTDHLFGGGGDAFFAWQSFCRGYHVIFMDDLEGLGIAGSWDFGATFGWSGNRAGIRAAMGQMQTAVGIIGNLNGVVPHDSFSSTGYCLANPGSKYIAYQPGTGAFTLNLSGFGTTTFSVTWINIATSGQVTGGSVVGGNAAQGMSPPFGGAAVAVLSLAVQPNTISVATISSQTQATSFAISGQYTGAAPTGMTCAFSIGGGSTTVGSFQAVGGNWSGNVTAPNTTGSTTLALTGIGPNTATTTSNSFTLTSATPSLTIGTIQNQVVLNTFMVGGTYGGPAPTGMTYVFSIGGSGTVANFQAQGGSWQGNVTAPNSTGSTTLDVTGTGPNTQSAVSNSFTLLAAGSAVSVATMTMGELSGSVAPSGSIFAFSQTFADGDVPSGSKVVGLTPASVVIQAQQDQEAYYDSGALKSAEISWLTPLSLSGGAKVASYAVARQTGSPNRVGISAAQIAANSNIVATLTGGDCGGTTYTVSFNEVIANFSDWAVSPWGGSGGNTYPVGGWEYIHQGPVRTTVRAWRYLRNSSTGRPHAYVRLELWVTLWATSYGNYTLSGPYDICPVIRQNNSYGPVSAIGDGAIGVPGNGSLGPHFFCQCLVSNNGTTIPTYGFLGGANDWRATTGISFNASTNQVTNPPGWATDNNNDFGVAVQFSNPPSAIGTGPVWFTFLNAANGLPSGYFLTAARYFSVSQTRAQSGVFTSGGFFSAWAGGKAFNPGIWTFANNQYFICTVGGTTSGSPPSGNGSDIIDGSVHWACGTLRLGSAPAGVTTYPLWGCHQLGKQAGDDIYSAPLWTGASARVRLDPGHDLAYLQSSGFLHKYYNPSQAASMMNVANPQPSFNAGSCPVAGGDSVCFWDWQFPGDDPAEERYLPINTSGIGWIYASQPSSPVDLATRQWYSRQCMSLALNAFDLACHYLDERYGRQLIVNNGHAKNGTTYTSCAPVNPGFAPFYSAGSPVRGQIAPNGYYDLSGYTGTASESAVESRPWDGTHFFTPWQAPWLKTGRHEFFEDGLDLAIVGTTNRSGFGPAVSGGFSDQTMTISGTTYYGTVFGSLQIRDWAASLTKMGQAAWVIADAHPLAQYIRDMLSDNGAGGAAFVGQMTGNVAALGSPGLNPVNYATPSYTPWHGHLYYITVCQLADNYGGAWETLRQHLTKFEAMWDSRTTVGTSVGCTYEVGLFDLYPFLPSLADWQPSPSGVFQNTYSSYGLGSFSCVATSIISQPGVRGGVWYPPPPQSQLIPLFGTSIFNLYRAGARWRQIIGDAPADALLTDLDARAANFGGVDYHSAKAGPNIGNFLQGNS